MKTYYKIVELKDGELLTLFHGINKSRRLQKGEWIKAEIKEGVQDGKGTKYTSGIHIIDGLDQTIEYLKRFSRTDRVVVECHAKGLRRKTKSREHVYLANEIKIISDPIELKKDEM